MQFELRKETFDAAANHHHHAAPTAVPTQHRFNPYADNGGTVLAIAGADFCLVAGDTRQSSGYSINTRHAPKVHKLPNGTVLAAQGMHADSLALISKLHQRQTWYQHKHNKHMGANATAQMLSTILYGKRFFPYSVWNVLGGLDDKGVGAVYSYDPVGNFRRCNFKAGGSSASLIQPFLDSQAGFKHQTGEVEHFLTLEQAIRLTRDAFTGATERDIYTGDGLEIFVIKKEGVELLKFDLKRD